jgi:serine/threonine-protein kinase
VAIKILRRDLAGFAGGARSSRERPSPRSTIHLHAARRRRHRPWCRALRRPRSSTRDGALEGETLEGASREALSLDDTLAYAVSASALGRAHAQGIVHRDLKPGNIMLARSGASRQGPPQVKLLDFGLAQLRAEQPPGAADVTQLTPPATRGVALGTLPYMAPEQLEGKDADARTDLFAFGAVVYEMATGHRAFDAPSQAGLIGAILTSDPPPIAAVNPAAPPALDRW